MNPASKVLTGADLPVDVIENVTTAATGANYTALPSVPGARIVRIVNPSVDVQVREVGGTKTVTFPANADVVLYVAQNSNQIEVRRADTSNTQATFGLVIGQYPV